MVRRRALSIVQRYSQPPHHQMEEETGAVSIYRKPSNFGNGNTRDRQGRLITCEHGGRRVARTEYDGSITVLINSFNGKKLNSPNESARVMKARKDQSRKGVKRAGEFLPGDLAGEFDGHLSRRISRRHRATTAPRARSQ